MELFKWLEDIQDLYKSLIEKAQKESIIEIKQLETERKNEMEKILKKKEEFVNSIINDLLKTMKNHISNFKSNNNKEIEKLKENYFNNRNNLVKSILEKLGYNF
ncbi:MAG: hypothetical protein ACFFDX_01230 [Candidatus Odinarchaeota archaeon]